MGRDLPPSSAFAGDDGSADAVLTDLLADLAAGRAGVPEVVAALAGTRVLVPVLAELGAAEVSACGHTVDKEASTGVVALQAPDGRTALPVFTSTAAMAAWRADARPVPASAPRAAAACLAEGWQVLVLDPGGPVTVVVPGPAVRALADGAAWDPAVIGDQVRPDVRTAVRTALAGLAHVASADAVPGRGAEVAVLLGIEPGLDRAGLDAVLARAGAALATLDVVAAAVDSLELRVTAER